MRYVWRDGCFRDRDTNEPMELPERDVCAPLIVSDLPAYMSPLGTGVIDGRAARREDMKRGNCREVDPQEWTPNEKFREKAERANYRS